MTVEKIEKDGVAYAVVVRAGDLDTERSTFFTAGEETLQIGTTANKAGYVEPVHYHRESKRQVTGAHQMLYVIKGKAAMDFFDQSGNLFSTVEINVGDMMLIQDGIHRIRMLTDFIAITAKQGPYISADQDKVNVDEQH